MLGEVTVAPILMHISKELKEVGERGLIGLELSASCRLRGSAATIS